MEAVRGLAWTELKRQRGDWGRDMAWYFGRRECGLSLRALGEASGGIDYATVSAGAKRIGRRLAKDADLAAKAKQIEQRMTRS